jgi:hypothetical protein
MSKDNSKSWDALWRGIKEYQEEFPDNLVFIGGIAVYCHSTGHDEANAFTEYTHDADFMIATPQFYELREGEFVTKNARLGKYQTERHGVEFDIYEQQISHLAVPVEEVIAASEIQNKIRVASLEHLLVLKTAAFLDRQSSPKGEKDANDITRILFLIADKQITPHRLKHLTPDMNETIERISKSDAPLRLARGNAHFAHKIRSKVKLGLEKVENGLKPTSKAKRITQDAVQRKGNDDFGR